LNVGELDSGVQVVMEYLQFDWDIYKNLGKFH
jgi:hypothetical protein